MNHKCDKQTDGQTRQTDRTVFSTVRIVRRALETTLPVNALYSQQSVLACSEHYRRNLQVVDVIVISMHFV